jgi:pyruvate,water dikinase
VAPDLRGFLAVVGTNIQEGNRPEFSENSYAFLSRDYMLLNLRMGYHFQTIEALATPNPTQNFVRLQFKSGGAPLDRRVRRVWLIMELLSRAGFENKSEADFLDTMVAYQNQERTLHALHLLGRVTILTKQLDMALSNDAVARWYADDIANKLEIT